MSKSDKAKKELDVFKQVFNYEDAKCKETSRIIRLLEDCRVISSDVPDIIAINDKEKIAYAIEEFRVDHHIKRQHGKIGAASITVNKDSKKIYEKYKDSVESQQLNIVNDINSIVAREVENIFNATYNNLLKSLDYSIGNHKSRLNDYKNNKAIPKDYNTKIVFLIEIYADFHNLYMCRYRSCEKNESGLMPIFDDVIDRFRNNIDGVEYVILLLKSYMNNNIKVIALDTSDIEESIRRNLINSYEYCGMDRYVKYIDDKLLNISFDKAYAENDTIKAYHHDCFNIDGNPYYLLAVFTACKRAMECKVTRKPYTIDRSVLFFMEVYGKNIIGWNNLYVEDLVEPIFNKIDKIVINRRIRRFDALYPFVGLQVSTKNES